MMKKTEAKHTHYSKGEMKVLRTRCVSEKAELPNTERNKETKTWKRKEIKKKIKGLKKKKK